MGIIVKLLGGPALTWSDGTDLQLPTRKSEALFAYLIERGGEGVSREALSALLWPYSGEDQARASLRQEISVLRKGLGAEFDDIIDFQGDRVSVTQRGLDVDIWALRAHRRLGHDPVALLALLDHYTAPFLDTFRIRSQPFSDWVWSMRQSLEAEMLSLGQAALSRCLSNQDDVNATQIATHLCRIEPTYEPAHQALIVHYLRVGDVAAARRQLLLCETALKGLLDTDVSPETRALFKTADDIPEGEQSGEGQLTDQRRFVTIFAAVASLDIADPEDFDREAALTSSLISDHITAKGGTVLSVMGGDVMACFGYPAAHDKDPETATFAAMALLQKMDAQSGVAGAAPIQIGLAQGMVLVSGRAQGTGHHKLSGAVLRTADGLARLGKVGTVNICAETARAVRHAFPLQPLSTPAGAQQVQVRETTHVLAEAKRNPLIGRAGPLAQLTTMLKQAKLGYGGVAAVLGQPGEGKSRLVHEVTDIATTQGFTVEVFQGRLSAQQSTFAPILARLPGRSQRGGPSPDNAALKDWLTTLNPSLVTALPYFEALVRAQGDAAFDGARIDDAAKQAALNLFVETYRARPRQSPTVLVFEDVHWFDQTTRDAISRLVEKVSDLPMLIAFASRIEGAPDITEHSAVQRIMLAPLGHDSAEKLLRGLLGSRKIPKATLTNVLGRSDGNPLIIEEFAKAIIFQQDHTSDVDVSPKQALVGGATNPALETPSRILPLLLARIDAVPGAIQALQYACLFGREFSTSNLAQVLRPLRIGPSLMDELVAADILLELSDSSEPVYGFRHAMISEAIYSTIPKTGRAKMHTAAAEALLASDFLVNLNEIARHYKAASNSIQAMKYFELAGDRAGQLSAHSEAMIDYQEAIDVAAQLPLTVERQRAELTLNSKMAAQLIALRGIPTAEVTPYYEQALALSQALEDDDAMINVIWVGWSIQLMVADLDQCREILGKLDALDQTASTTVSYVIGQYMHGVTDAYRGDLVQAAKHLESVLAVYSDDMKDALQTRVGMDIALTTNSFLGWVYALLGRADDADTAVQNALAMAQANDNGLSLVFADIFTATKCLFLNDFKAARVHAERAQSKASEMGYRQWSAQARMQLGRIADVSGDPNALETLLLARDEYLETGMSLARPYLEVWIAEAQSRKGQFEAALATLDGLAEYTERSSEKYFDFAQRNARKSALLGMETT